MVTIPLTSCLEEELSRVKARHTELKAQLGRTDDLSEQSEIVRVLSYLEGVLDGLRRATAYARGTGQVVSGYMV